MHFNLKNLLRQFNVHKLLTHNISICTNHIHLSNYIQTSTTAWNIATRILCTGGSLANISKEITQFFPIICYLLRSMNLWSMYRSLIQPTKSLVWTWKLVGKEGRPPICNGPVRSRNLWQVSVNTAHLKPQTDILLGQQTISMKHWTNQQL